MLLFLDEACLGQLTFELAEDLLLREALPPELDECIHLLCTGYRLDTLAALAVELVDQHLDESAHMLEAAQSRRC